MLFPAFSKLDPKKDSEIVKNVYQFSVKYASARGARRSSCHVPVSASSFHTLRDYLRNGTIIFGFACSKLPIYRLWEPEHGEPLKQPRANQIDAQINPAYYNDRYSDGGNTNSAVWCHRFNHHTACSWDSQSLHSTVLDKKALWRNGRLVFISKNCLLICLIRCFNIRHNLPARFCQLDTPFTRHSSFCFNLNSHIIIHKINHQIRHKQSECNDRRIRPD